MRQALCMEEDNDIITCDEFEYPLDIRLVSYTFEYRNSAKVVVLDFSSEYRHFPKETFASDDEKEA